MFQRALKTKFNEEKYLQISTVRLRRIAPEEMCLKGKRIAIIYGLFFTAHFIKFYRKTDTHKVCYVPMRRGLAKIDEEPYNQVCNESAGYGGFPGYKGRVHF